MATFKVLRNLSFKVKGQHTFFHTIGFLIYSNHNNVEENND